jgi:hypothetical protein
MSAKILCSHWSANEHFFSVANILKGKYVKNVKIQALSGVFLRSEDIQDYLAAAQ